MFAYMCFDFVFRSTCIFKIENLILKMKQP